MTYLDWLSELVIPDRQERVSYQKLMRALYSEVFRWSVSNDGNRATDGMNLRTTYEDEMGLFCEKEGPCSVLEMMVALAVDCENSIMYDPDEGDRTGLWFWEMIENLGLDSQDDWGFDFGAFKTIMRRFLDRKYDRNGCGGPFYIENFGQDMRRIELWYQLNYYMKSRYF